MLRVRSLPLELALVPLGAPGDTLVEWLAAELSQRLGTPVSAYPPLAPRVEWLDAERGQYSSNRIVDALTDELAGDEEPRTRWLLAVADVDLYAADRPFVFGEATLGGCCALVGLERLRVRGDAGDGSRFAERVLKEAIHELGHVAGLSHCSRSYCVMAESVEVSDIDSKGAEFCPVCRAQLPGLPDPPPDPGA